MVGFVGVTALRGKNVSRQQCVCNVIATPEMLDAMVADAGVLDNRGEPLKEGIHRLKWLDSRESENGRRVIIAHTNRSEIRNPLRSICAMKAFAEYDQFLRELAVPQYCELRDSELYFSEAGGLTCPIQSRR
uniref:Uncharacterized protein n=1 Tax=Rhodosorus marinus TaxID=101924 RepID=A0A7S0BLV9_9RHOD|mmetsp:Transcript_21224/g.30835  ORF Transcript_21224/g.30835 Transcript_21224/m.30835 type:complete len:132 (+) Transcript_21224:139-534(+)